jgi:DNA invertase Pin-like site-specific DNA recombinase
VSETLVSQNGQGAVSATGYLLGYARVSTTDQDPALQLDALTAAGCPRIFTDKASGARDDRPELARLLDVARPGDVVVVWKLDRLGRSLRHLIEVVGELERRGVGFKSLRESIDTTTVSGKLVFHIFAALAEFERELIVERTTAGLQAARARGRVGGRPRALDPVGVATARDMVRSGRNVTEIARTLGVSRATVYRSLPSSSV